MKNKKQIAGLLFLSLLFMFLMHYFTFEEKKIFWYLYAFTLLIGTAIAILYSDLKDELATWKYLLFGIGYGTITYGIIRLGYIILTYIDSKFAKAVSKFLSTYGPENIWHYLLLIFIIVVSEELFWRGFIQQQLKLFVSKGLAVFITSVLFALCIAISGFIYGALAAFVVGLIFGALYEWKKSIPLIVVAHEVFILLLFLILPL